MGSKTSSSCSPLASPARPFAHPPHFTRALWLVLETDEDQDGASQRLSAPAPGQPTCHQLSPLLGPVQAPPASPYASSAQPLGG